LRKINQKTKGENAAAERNSNQNKIKIIKIHKNKSRQPTTTTTIRLKAILKVSYTARNFGDWSTVMQE